MLELPSNAEQQHCLNPSQAATGRLTLHLLLVSSRPARGTGRSTDTGLPSRAASTARESHLGVGTPGWRGPAAGPAL